MCNVYISRQARLSNQRGNPATFHLLLRGQEQDGFILNGFFHNKIILHYPFAEQDIEVTFATSKLHFCVPKL